MTNPLVLNFVNLALCIAWAAASACRLHAMHDRVKLQAALFYVGMFAGAGASGLQFYLFGRLAGWPDVVVSASMCVALWLTLPHWRNGPPRHCMRRI